MPTKAVFFFWNSESVKHYKEIHVRIADLKTKYPEYTFMWVLTPGQNLQPGNKQL